MANSTCSAKQGTYIQSMGAFQQAELAYKPCSTTDQTTYNQYPIIQTIQPIPNPKQILVDTRAILLSQYNTLIASYSSLLSSTKALIAATQPLQSYKSMLQSQLDASSQQMNMIQQQIATESTIITQTNATNPELSNIGPFGTSNVQTGVSAAFLTFYSIFFILISAILYLQFKNSVSSASLIIGIILLLTAAGTGAYFCAISNDYGLGLLDPQSLIMMNLLS
jgi:hypothetical protein